METSRRGFIEGLTIGLSSNAAYGLLQGVGPNAWRTLTKLVPDESWMPNEVPTFQERFSPNALKAVKTLFGDRGDIVKLVGGRAHYQYPNEMHPDDKWACDTIGKYAEQLAEKYQYDPNYGDIASSGSFVCTGSPVSNAWSRLFLEYNYINRGNPAQGLTRIEKPRIDLPFAFELSQETIRHVAKQARHQTEIGRSVSNWSIRTRSGHVLSPDTKNRTSDFLLVTRIPNWREERSPHSDFKNTITIFGGTHGVGTAAVRLLLQDSKLLTKVIMKTSETEFWQLLLTIDSMDSDAHPHSKGKRLVGKTINPNFEFEPINI